MRRSLIALLAISSVIGVACGDDDDTDIENPDVPGVTDVMTTDPLMTDPITPTTEGG
ncbi:MAG: hypothetical protein Q7V62_15895 [Actinomycetota bacterium]|nr:hypothetical protein [Actinomycetota bacterium]